MAEARNRSGLLGLLRVACGGLAVTVCVLAGATPAAASVSHDYSHSIGGAASSPPNPYPLSGPTDLSLDEETRDVYVTDPGNHRVQKFDASGNFLLMFGKGVNQTTGGDVCTAGSGDTCQAGAAVASPGGLQTPVYLAVDNSAGPSAGAVYVADSGTHLVQKFESSGNLVSSWGVGGQKDGTDATIGSTNLLFNVIVGLDVNSADGHLFVAGTNATQTRDRPVEYAHNGTFLRGYISTSATGFDNATWLKVDEAGNLYSASEAFASPAGAQIFESVPNSAPSSTGFWQSTRYEMTTDWPTTGFAIDPATGELYQGVGDRDEDRPTDHGPRINHYSADCNPPVSGRCDPVDFFGEGHLSGAMGVAVEGETHSVYVVNETGGEVAVFADVRPIVTTGAATDITDSSVTLNGTIDPAGRGDIDECRFEYGFDRTYGTSLPCSPDPESSPPGSHFNAPTDVTASITGLSPGTELHYRLTAGNVSDASVSGIDRTFRTTAAPAIIALRAENLTATTSDLSAQVNPNGRETRYRFEYGTAVSYGQRAPQPDGVIAASYDDRKITVHLDGLTSGATYHYRLVAENGSGSTVTEDHTFNFYPPSCPNENVRQQTQTNYLPDCRAYELVSPGDAGGTQLFPNGPNTGHATSPSRFSYTGLFSTVPGSGGSPIDGSGDLYIATRTGTGWVSRYVGLPAQEAAVVGGPAMGPPGSTPGPIRDSSQMAANAGHTTGSQDGVLTDLRMERFLSFNVGNQSVGSPFTLDFQNPTPIASNAPFVFAADGTRLDRWPTNLSVVPDGSYPEGSGLVAHGGEPHPPGVAPGGARALDCPQAGGARSYCPGDVTASSDLGNFVFATRWNVFAEDGRLNAPGSVYDNDTERGTVVVASKTPTGDDIPSEATNHAGDPLQIPKVSVDGSRILIAAGGTGPCGTQTCPVPPCGDDYSATRRCPMQPSHLYMRVDGAITYDVSRGHHVDYAGATDDASRVFFFSDEPLSSEDQDTSTDLYQWSEATDSLSLLSIGNDTDQPGEPGNSDACAGGLVDHHAGMTTKCGVTTYTQWFFCAAPGGGNCISDNFTAGESGDIYFFSPELLDGSRGIPQRENMYVYRNGRVEYVTTLSGDPTCYDTYSIDTCARVMRMQISPDGNYMAFITASPVTRYDNGGRMEMYRYNAETRNIICVSCLPSGEKPSSDVEASQNGLFMTDDGRTFFTTEDALVHADTNRAQDVYEYVDGRPQLITLGTGDTRAPADFLGFFSPPGLIGVSADGQDVYFATYDTLVRQDANGLFLKFYDARTGGGFSAPAPPPPCEAAIECHGPASAPPPPLPGGTRQALGSGGNASPASRRRARKRTRSQRRRARRQRAAGKRRKVGRKQRRAAAKRRKAVRTRRGAPAKRARHRPRRAGE